MTITWAAIQNVYAEAAADHLSRAQTLGLECPLDVRSFTSTTATRTSPKSCASSIGQTWNGMRLRFPASRSVASPFRDPINMPSTKPTGERRRRAYKTIALRSWSTGKPPAHGCAHLSSSRATFWDRHWTTSVWLDLPDWGTSSDYSIARKSPRPRDIAFGSAEARPPESPGEFRSTQ